MKLLTATKVADALAERVACSFADAQYVLVGESWLLDEFLPWWERHKRQSGMVYHPGVTDCENYAREFVTWIGIAARKVTVDAGIAAAWLTVRNLTESLGIPAGAHALNLVGTLTEAGPRWLVIEPQNSRHELLENYHTADRLHACF